MLMRQRQCVCVCVLVWHVPGKPYRRGKLSTVDLLVLPSLDQLLLIVQTLFTFFTKQATLMRRLTVQKILL
jgi:hypothetical protein